MFEKVSRPLKCHSKFLGSHIYHIVFKERSKERLTVSGYAFVATMATIPSAMPITLTNIVVNLVS